MINIIGHRKIFLSVSALLVAAAIVCIIVFGFRAGIDFTGGTLWQVKLAESSSSAEATAGKQNLTAGDLNKFFEENLNIKNARIFPAADQSFLVRIGHISEDEHQSLLSSLRSGFSSVEELKFEVIGPSIGKELRQKAVWAIVLVLLGISLYIIYAFRKVSYPIKSWKYGIAVLISLSHDVIIPAGMLAVLGWKLGVEIDTNFIVALLFIMGFSVHDTIVVFDRIRENLLDFKNKTDLQTLINNSVNSTLARSVNTSLTLIIVLIAMFFLGPVTLKYFILTILVGSVVGTYSSIFVASPLLLYFTSGVKK
jgi:preprotein translocase subunit SecF